MIQPNMLQLMLATASCTCLRDGVERRLHICVPSMHRRWLAVRVTSNVRLLTPHPCCAVQSPGKPRGAAGLANLGNTCFMNSSLQCLAHAAPLMRVFLGGAYKAEINPDNPLGRGGELAEAFGSLMQKLWKVGVETT